MPQIVIHLTTPPSEAAREAALAPNALPWWRELLGGWRQYIAQSGTSSRTNRIRAAVEADAERLGLAVEVVSPASIPDWVREQGYIPNDLRDTELGFCAVELSALVTGGDSVSTSDPTHPQQEPFKFVARDADGRVFGVGFCSQVGATRALDSFAKLGATHLDLYRRTAPDRRIDEIRWTPPTAG